MVENEKLFRTYSRIPRLGLGATSKLLREREIELRKFMKLFEILIEKLLPTTCI